MTQPANARSVRQASVVYGTSTRRSVGGKTDSAALQIMSLVDALSVQSAIRGTFDYTDVRTLVTAVTEQILGLRLRP